jgi:hypothetical protein
MLAIIYLLCRLESVEVCFYSHHMLLSGAEGQSLRLNNSEKIAFIAYSRLMSSLRYAFSLFTSCLIICLVLLHFFVFLLFPLCFISMFPLCLLKFFIVTRFLA